MSDNKLNSNPKKQNNNTFASEFLCSVTEINKTKEPKIPKSKQSANALFTFMDKSDFLKDILQKKRIYPRYCYEKLDYLALNGLPGVAFPMKCFCDIFITRLIEHTKTYGKYGIAFTKEWGIKNNIQPVHYINPIENSFDIESIKILYEKKLILEANYKKNHTILEPEKNIFHELLYNKLRLIKPINGTMIRNGSETDTLNFHDEHEWRYVLNVNYDTADAAPYLSLNDDLIQASNKLSKNPNYGLKFNVDDVKYIVLENTSDKQPFFKYICNNCGYTEDEAYMLISKINVLEELEGDM